MTLSPAFRVRFNSVRIGALSSFLSGIVMNSDANTADPFPDDRQIENLTEKPSGRVIAWPCYQPCLLVVMAMIAGIGVDRLLDVDAKITLSMAAVLWVVGIAIASKFRNSPSVKSAKMASWLLLIAIGLGGSGWHHQCWNWIRSWNDRGVQTN